MSIVRLATLISCGGNTENQETTNTLDKEALSQFLTAYNAEYQRLLTIASEAEWKLNTYIVEGDTVSGKAASASRSRICSTYWISDPVRECIVTS